MEEIVKSGTLVDWVESQIIKDIRQNKMKIGAEIPNEMELAVKYDVGRNVIRESLSRLRMLGIIESRKRRGMVVAEPNIIHSLKKVINPYMLSKETILNLLGMRVSLEIGCASFIINNVTDDDIKELKKIVAREAKTKDIKIDIEAEQAFHSKIYSIAKNRVMLDFISLLLPVFRYVNDHFEDFDRFNQMNAGARQQVGHKELVSFLEARDLKGYQKAVEEHLRAYIDYINFWSKLDLAY